MSNQRTFKQLDIFLSHYYVQSFNFDELDKLVYDYRFREHDKYYKEFLSEVSYIVETKNWAIVKSIFKENGKKNDVSIIKKVIEVIYKALTDQTWSKDSYKPFIF